MLRYGRHSRPYVVRSLQMLLAGVGASFVFARELVRGGEDRFGRALGRALVRGCTDLGATFIKVGQIASTRADLLPPAVVRELYALRDRVPPFSFSAVRRTIAQDFGGSIERFFSSFDPVPVAAASVAQVHRAVRRDTGEVVAVKVLRPDIGGKIQLDRTILLFLGRALERLVPSMRLISLEGALRSFCDAVEQQTHFRIEAENNRRFQTNFADDEDVRFPRLHADFCSDRVLTMEFIEGVREEEIEAAGIDVHRVVVAGMRCVCRMIFSHGFVHADLHPGNMRFFPPAHVVLFDLGLTGSLVDVDRLTLAETLYAFATGDGVTVARLFHANAPSKATRDYAAYEREIVELVDDVRRRGLGNLQVTLEIGRIFDILRRHQIQARSHMTMVNLALMTAEGLGKRLDPSLSLADAALPYLEEALKAADYAEERRSDLRPSA